MPDIEKLRRDAEAAKLKAEQAENRLKVELAKAAEPEIATAVATLTELYDKGVAVKDVQKAIRKLVGHCDVNVVSGSSPKMSTKEKREMKKNFVQEFVGGLNEETFTLPALAEKAKDKGLSWAGSAEQYFKTALDELAQKTNRKDGVSVIWKRKK